MAMVAYVLFLYANTFFHFPFSRYSLYISSFLMYLYTFFKCLFGITILSYKIINKNKMQHSWKNVIILLPSVLLIVYCLYFFCDIIISGSFELNEINFVLMPLSWGFSFWFPSFDLNLIFFMVILTGIFMWLVYWTLYNRNNRKGFIILLNIITPVNIAFLFIVIMYMYTK